jgi:hypothetical protein
MYHKNTDVGNNIINEKAFKEINMRKDKTG